MYRNVKGQRILTPILEENVQFNNHPTCSTCSPQRYVIYQKNNKQIKKKAVPKRSHNFSIE
jgi:hypothetical protein